MPAITATRPPGKHTPAAHPAPGISTAEADMITAAARRFLTHTAHGPHPVTTATITYQIGTLFTPYTPASIGKYECGMPNSTHWCV